MSADAAARRPYHVSDSQTRRRFQTALRNRMTGPELLDSLNKSFGAKIQNKTEFRGETTYTIAPADLREITKILS
jgi:hypothetical protein